MDVLCGIVLCVVFKCNVVLWFLCVCVCVCVCVCGLCVFCLCILVHVCVPYYIVFGYFNLCVMIFK